MDLREQDFGIEIEMTGITRCRAGKVLADFFGTESVHDGGHYDIYSVLDQDGRRWKVMSDGSIDCETWQNGARWAASKAHSVELVSPICQYQDIPVLQEIVRQLRTAGAFANDSCGIHIHINAAPFTAPKLRNLVNIIAAKEDMVYRALRVDRDRADRYCKKIDPAFLERLNRQRPQTMEALKNLWYNGRDGSHLHYHESRYHCLNLHSVFQKGTIEFRAFNGELHAGKIKAYIQFCMAIAAQAYNQRSATPAKTISDNEKYTFRVWLLRLGMIGDEFKTARLHLLDHLEGNVAWRDPAQAQRQKERLKAQREMEQSGAQPEPEAEMQIEPEEIEQQNEPEEQSFGFSMSM